VISAGDLTSFPKRIGISIWKEKKMVVVVLGGIQDEAFWHFFFRDSLIVDVYFLLFIFSWSYLLIQSNQITILTKKGPREKQIKASYE
jgi:hypothetical protein